MISFRTHLVTLVSVFLALAVGVVLGGGPLSEVGRDSEAGPGSVDVEAAARTEAEADYGDRFAGATAASLYAGRLADRPVTVVTLPGASEETVAALTEQVTAAGGTVTGTHALAEAMVSPNEKSLVDTLGSQLAAQLPKETVSADAPTYERIGQLLGFSLAVSAPEAGEPTAQTTAVLEGLRGADLLPDATPVESRSPLLLVVLGDEVGGDGGGDGGDDILGGLVRGLASSALGVVLAADTSDGSDQLGRLRAASALGTATSVDGVETAPGRVAAVLGLVRSLTVQGGAFGASGADGAVPLG